MISESMIKALAQKWGILTAIELRHIEQSCEVCGAPPDSPDMVMFRRRLCVVRLKQGVSNGTMHDLERGDGNELKSVELVLPTTVQLQPHLDATEDHLLSSFKVYSELHDISIVDRERLALRAGRAQPYVVQESPTRALDILNVPLALLVPELAMSPTHNLGLEADRSGGRDVGGHILLCIPLRIPSHSYDLAPGG